MVSRKEHAGLSECPIARALDVVGDHWTLLIIRDMIFSGAHEFCDLQECNEGISTNILSDRLARLQKHDLIRFIPHPRNRRHKLYYLTPSGKGLIQVLISIGTWSQTHLGTRVQLPSDYMEALAKGPQTMVDAVMQDLQEWEQLYGIA